MIGARQSLSSFRPYRESRICDLSLVRLGAQKSKCRFWCPLRGSTSLISPLIGPRWTDVIVEFFRAGVIAMSFPALRRPGELAQRYDFGVFERPTGISSI